MRRTVYILAVIGLATTVCLVVVAVRTGRGNKAQLVSLEQGTAIPRPGRCQGTVQR